MFGSPLAVRLSKVRKTERPDLLIPYCFGDQYNKQIGSVIIILHAPADRDVETVDEILEFAKAPGESGQTRRLAS